MVLNQLVDIKTQKRDFKPIGRHKNAKNAILNELVDTKNAKNAILNQLIDTKTPKLLLYNQLVDTKT